MAEWFKLADTDEEAWEQHEPRRRGSPRVEMHVDELMSFWVPAAEWSWQDELMHLLNFECPRVVALRDGSEQQRQCPRPDGICTRRGCAQRALEDDVRERGVIEAVTLGRDGRVRDGHRRMVAALRTGLERVPVRDPLERRECECGRRTVVGSLQLDADRGTRQWAYCAACNLRVGPSWTVVRPWVGV